MQQFFKRLNDRMLFLPTKSLILRGNGESKEYLLLQPFFFFINWDFSLSLFFIPSVNYAKAIPFQEWGKIERSSISTYIAAI